MATPSRRRRSARSPAACSSLPFFLLSALSGQLADAHDKARIVRIVKTAEIGIMLFGAAGLLLHNIPLLLAALAAMGIHSTFFGPIKYAILPEHLEKDEVLGGTGLVEAGTYIAILGGTILGGLLVLERADGSYHAEWAALAVLVVAVLGRIAGGKVPPAPPVDDPELPGFPKRGWTGTSCAPRSHWSARHCMCAACSSPSYRSAFSGRWAQCSPLNSRRWSRTAWARTRPWRPFPGGLLDRGRDRLGAGQSVAQGSGCRAVRARLRAGHGHFRARPVPASAAVAGEQRRTDVDGQFFAMPNSWMIVVDLLGVAVAGGMFVVPLYAFLTTTVPKSETARTIAANNIVNSGFMVAATAILAIAIGFFEVTVADSLLIVAVGSVLAAWLGWKLHLACDEAVGARSGDKRLNEQETAGRTSSRTV